MKPVIYTDLDGTLLDESYSYNTSESAVKWLKRLNYPLVFCSSKTRAEQEYYRVQLNNTDPFIVENGNAIFIPKGYFPGPVNAQRETDHYLVLELGVAVSSIRKALRDICNRTGIDFQFYHQLTSTEISRITGLDKAAARRAADREYSETILTPLKTPELRALRTALQQQGLAIVSGGRFYTVSAAKTDKGNAVRTLTNLYQQTGKDILTIGIGDSPNDRPMLANVDEPYLVQQSEGRWTNIRLPKLRKMNAVGPNGWILVISLLQAYLCYQQPSSSKKRR